MKPILEVLAGRRQAVPPVWFMRQAGRYLPEYRSLRERAGSFLNLCFTPELAAEATLQPIHRFGFDAAILFSDILVVPHALGRAVTFEAGEGPRLEPLDDAAKLNALASTADDAVFVPVYEAVRRVKRKLPANVALLGFCGAPWTVATYMVAGQGTPDQAPARMMAYRHPEAFAKIIGFPRGAGALLPAYVEATGVNAVSIDWAAEPSLIRERVQSRVAVQGNLDPLALIAGGAALDRAVDDVLANYAAGRLIFNLGHGIQPETPIAHVEQMLQRVRAYKG